MLWGRRYVLDGGEEVIDGDGSLCHRMGEDMLWGGGHIVGGDGEAQHRVSPGSV